jgi:hypothetical protein
LTITSILFASSDRGGLGELAQPAIANPANATETKTLMSMPSPIRDAPGRDTSFSRPIAAGSLPDVWQTGQAMTTGTRQYAYH